MYGVYISCVSARAKMKSWRLDTARVHLPKNELTTVLFALDVTLDGWRRNGAPGCGICHFDREVVRRSGHEATEGETTTMVTH